VHSGRNLISTRQQWRRSEWCAKRTLRFANRPFTHFPFISLFIKATQQADMLHRKSNIYAKDLLQLSVSTQLVCVCLFDRASLIGLTLTYGALAKVGFMSSRQQNCKIKDIIQRLARLFSCTDSCLDLRIVETLRCMAVARVLACAASDQTPIIAAPWRNTETTSGADQSRSKHTTRSR
jgi:hypothetical protein